MQSFISFFIVVWLILPNRILGVPPQVGRALENAMETASGRLGSQVPHLVVPGTLPHIPVPALKIPYMKRFEQSLLIVQKTYTETMAKYGLLSSRERSGLLKMITLAELSGIKQIPQRMIFRLVKIRK